MFLFKEPLIQFTRFMRYMIEDSSRQYSTDAATLLTLSVLFGVAVVLFFYFARGPKKLY